MKHIRNYFAITLITLIFIFCNNAFSGERTISSHLCHSRYDNSTIISSGPPGQAGLASSYLGNSNNMSNSVGAGKYVYCPVTSDNYIAHSNVTLLVLVGNQSGNDGSFSRACVKHYNNPGFSCGPPTVFGYGGENFSYVDTAKWNEYSSSFPYILNYLTQEAVLSGFKVYD